MAAPGSLSTQRSYDETFELITQWTGAGGASLTKVQGRGVVSVVWTATGIFTVTFTDDLGGRLADVSGTTHSLATIQAMTWKANYATYDTAAKTIQVECWGVGGGVLVDPAASSTVALRFTFYKNNS